MLVRVVVLVLVGLVVVVMVAVVVVMVVGVVVMQGSFSHPPGPSRGVPPVSRLTSWPSWRCSPSPPSLTTLR